MKIISYPQTDKVSSIHLSPSLPLSLSHCIKVPQIAFITCAVMAHINKQAFELFYTSKNLEEITYM